MLTSVGWKSAFGPMFLATSSPLLDGRSAIITFAPRFARRSTVALPNPEAPPVIYAQIFLEAMFY